MEFVHTSPRSAVFLYYQAAESNMSLPTTSRRMTRSTPAAVNASEVPIISHPIAILLCISRTMKLKDATFLCLFPLSWNISLTSFNARPLFAILMFAVRSSSFLVPLTYLLMVTPPTLTHMKLTSSITKTRTLWNRSLRDLGKPNLTRVTRTSIVRTITTLMRVTDTSSAMDSNPTGKEPHALQRLLHPPGTSLRMVLT